MGLFRKNNELSFVDDSGKTPVKFRDQSNSFKGSKKRRLIRFFFFLLLFSVLISGAYSGFRAYSALRSMFSDGTGDLLKLFSNNQSQKLKGELSGRTNILLLGIGDEGHSGATLSDTLIIASIDARTKNVALFSIPRDLYVRIPGYGYNKINAAHAFGERDKIDGGGPGLAKRTLEEVLGITIHYYVRVDFSGLEKIVDSLGGVTVDVENSFCDYNYPVERKGDTRKVCFQKGIQLMNGTRALQFARSRHALGEEGSDFARSKRQQKLLLAIKEKALSINTVFNPKKSVEFLEALGSHIKTDFTPVELPRLYELSKNIDSSKVIIKNFDNSTEGLLISESNPTAGYILKPRAGNFKEIQEVVRNIFSTIFIKEENARLSVLNGTYVSSLANTVGQNLKKQGYNVVFMGNAKSKNHIKTLIFDYTQGKKPETRASLEKEFGVIAQSASTTENEGYDFKIIIGRDYRGY